jgi:hypothetical protein
MKKILGAFILFLSIISSCNKKDAATNEPSSFTWIYQNQPYTATSSEAYLLRSNPNTNQILAYVNGDVTRYKLSILLPALNPNNYPVSFTTNAFEYIDDFGFVLGAVSGSVTISSNSSNKLSGSFDVKMLKGIADTVSMQGQFYNVPIR